MLALPNLVGPEKMLKMLMIIEIFFFLNSNQNIESNNDN